MNKPREVIFNSLQNTLHDGPAHWTERILRDLKDAGWSFVPTMGLTDVGALVQEVPKRTADQILQALGLPK